MSVRLRRRGDLKRARVIPALVFAVIWMLGFEVVPVAHQVMHAQIGAHTHGAAHCHSGFCHSEDGADRAGASQRSTSHGAGSLEHRGIAALAPEITLYVPELMLAGELPPDVVLAARVESFERVSPPATGPPA
jgi:hypothetical protein